MILNCNNICKTFITDDILKNVSFHIEDGEKAAIVGINGAGKSTLLKIIVGELEADSGSVTIAKDASIGYLAQHQDISSDRTIYEEVMTVKEDIINLELTLRSLEKQMNMHPVTNLMPCLKHIRCATMSLNRLTDTLQEVRLSVSLKVSDSRKKISTRKYPFSQAVRKHVCRLAGCF